MIGETSHLHGLEAHILRFVCEVETPLRLYTHKGSALRGAWVEALLSRACPQPWACAGASCRMQHGCPIAAIVGPADEAAERGRDVPRPYVVEPPLDSRTDYAPGDTLEWRMTLFGSATDWFPYIVMAARLMGERGLGAQVQGSSLKSQREALDQSAINNPKSLAGRFRLHEVWAENPLEGEHKRLYTRNESKVDTPSLPITHGQVLVAASRLPHDRITLHLKTPLRLGKDPRETAGARKLTHDLPPFHTLISRLDGRLRDLARHYTTYTPAPLQAHDEDNPKSEIRSLNLEVARQVVAEGEVEWLALERYSSRQDRRLPMGGLRGRVMYRGDLAPFLPLLIWGQFSHIGKYAVMGNGKYEIGVELSP